MTIARTLSDSFAGIHYGDTLPFIAAQLMGALLALATKNRVKGVGLSLRWLDKANLDGFKSIKIDKYFRDIVVFFQWLAPWVQECVWPIAEENTMLALSLSVLPFLLVLLVIWWSWGLLCLAQTTMQKG